MVRLVLPVLICLMAVGSIAYVALWRSQDQSAWQIQTTPNVANAAPKPPAAAEIQTPPQVEVAMDRETPFDPGLRDARSRLGRSARAAMPGGIRPGARGRRKPVKDDEILWKLEDAIRAQDSRTARELTRDLVRAIREGRIETEDAVDRLIASLKAAGDPTTIRGVIPQLGYLQNEKLTQFFQEQYWTTQDLTVRGMYLNALRQGASGESISFLQQVLETEEKQSLRNQALFALSRVADEKSLGILEEKARTGSGVDQQTALQLLSNRRDSSYAPLFEDVLTRNDGSRVYETAIRGLQQVGTPSSIPILQGVIDNPDVTEYVKNLARVAVRSIQQRAAGQRGRDLSPQEE